MEGGYDGIFAIRMKSDVSAGRATTMASRARKVLRQAGHVFRSDLLSQHENGEPLALHERRHPAAHARRRRRRYRRALLARKNASTVGMLGSGGMARDVPRAPTARCDRSDGEGVQPDPGQPREFAKRMSERQHRGDPGRRAREAVRGVDILSPAPTAWCRPSTPSGSSRACTSHVGAVRAVARGLARFDVCIRQGVGGSRLPETDRIRWKSATARSPMSAARRRR